MLGSYVVHSFHFGARLTMGTRWFWNAFFWPDSRSVQPGESCIANLMVLAAANLPGVRQEVWKGRHPLGRRSTIESHFLEGFYLIFPQSALAPAFEATLLQSQRPPKPRAQASWARSPRREPAMSDYFDTSGYPVHRGASVGAILCWWNSVSLMPEKPSFGEIGPPLLLGENIRPCVLLLPAWSWMLTISQSRDA